MNSFETKLEDGEMIFISGYTFGIVYTDNLHHQKIMRGDSGSCIWDCKYGVPIAQITYSHGEEGIGIPLKDIFDEVQDMTGLSVELPRE